MAREFDVALFAFEDGAPVTPADAAPVLEFCARVVLVEKPRYREPRWSSLLPPDVHEFRSPAMRRALAEVKRSFGHELLQVEYTQLAEYGGDVLVEHDVTFDLYGQIKMRQPGAGAWWDWYRWHRFETGEVRKRQRVVVMSEKDAEMLGRRFRRWRSRTVWIWTSIRRSRNGMGNGCCSSALSGTSPISMPTGFSRSGFGPSYATSFPNLLLPQSAGRTI
jgi:hypothetical protein